MANREKGEVALTIEGTDYTLVLNLNALAEIQALFSTEEVRFDERTVKDKDGRKKTITVPVKVPVVPSLEDIDRWVTAGSILHVRAMFWGALRKYHPTIDISRAGELLQAGGEEASASLRRALGLADPDPQDVDELAPVAAADGDPQRAGRRRGTGGKRASSLARPA